MLEFNIQPVRDEWVNLPVGIDCNIFLPRDYPSKVIKSPDSCCYIEVLGCVLSFSYEFYCIRVTFESGEMTEELATKVVESISRGLIPITGQEAFVECISS